MELAYIQKQDGEFINSSAYQAWEGFKSLGIQTNQFEYKQLINGHLPIPLSKETLVCGYISSVRWALEELKITEPKIEDYPLELMEYCGREIYLSTLEEFQKTNQRKFIKPVDVKLFKGIVCKDNVHAMIETALHPNDTKIYVSEVVNFISEYRVFINQGLMIGCRHYAGDFTVFPDFEIVQNAVNDYHSAPIAYSIDFGITYDHRTLLIEVNDAWSLGCYGLDSKLYANLLLNRWEEIVYASPTSLN